MFCQLDSWVLQQQETTNYLHLPSVILLLNDIKMRHLPLFDFTSSDRWSSGLEASIERGCWAGSAPERPRRLAAVLGGAPASPGWGIIGMGGAAWVGSC